MQVQLPQTTAVPANQRADVHRTTAPKLCPFSIVVDTAEQGPYTFAGIQAFSEWGNGIVRFEPGVNLLRHCLGRYPNSLGDYSIEGFIGRCHVERKSTDDAYSTFLGYSNGHQDTMRLDRFVSELRNLANTECSCVIVEQLEEPFYLGAPEWEQGRKTSEVNERTLRGNVRAWRQDWGIQIIFCDGRRAAEIETFRWLARFYKHHKKELKK